MPTTDIMSRRLIREISLHSHRSEKYPVVKAAQEIHLRRLTIDEALLRLDRYLNDAFLGGLPTVRVIHGKGTGALRQAVREELKGHPLVKSFRPAEFEQGGDGATIVELATR
ncbi:MAG: Smr/MutS family protein [Dehalococcoidia bacterium]